MLLLGSRQFADLFKGSSCPVEAVATCRRRRMTDVASMQGKRLRGVGAVTDIPGRSRRNSLFQSPASSRRMLHARVRCPSAWSDGNDADEGRIWQFDVV